MTSSSHRQLDLINIAFEARRRDLPLSVSDGEVASNLYVDLSQAANRRPWSCRFRTIRAKSHVYSFAKDRCITGTDQLRLQGWPAVFMDGECQLNRAELAESALPLPIVVLLETLMWCNPHGEWNQGSPCYSMFVVMFEVKYVKFSSSSLLQVLLSSCVSDRIIYATQAPRQRATIMQLWYKRIIRPSRFFNATLPICFNRLE